MAKVIIKKLILFINCLLYISIFNLLYKIRKSLLVKAEI